MALRKHNASKDLSVFYPDELRHVWREDKDRPWVVYSKERFRVFWDSRETPK